MKRLVSVIIPAYNASATIDETLASVRAQTWTDLDILVVDDGSIDDTAARVQRHVDADDRIRLIKVTNGGVASARNAGIREAQGDFIAPVDADDLWSPTKIERQMAAMDAEGDHVGLVYTWYKVIDDHGRIISQSDRHHEQGDVLKRMCLGNLVGNGSAPLMRKACVMAAGGYDPELREKNAQGCEDLKLYFEIARHHHFAVVPDFLTAYRWTVGNMSSQVDKMLRSYELVMTPFESVYGQQYRREFAAGRVYLIKWMYERALKSNDWKAALYLWQQLWTRNRRAALKRLALLPIDWFNLQHTYRPGAFFLPQQVHP